MIMEASVDPQPWGPDWMPITLKIPHNGVLFACRNSPLKPLPFVRHHCTMLAQGECAPGEGNASDLHCCFFSNSLFGQSGCDEIAAKRVAA
jgi:hypothetical protein